MACSLAEQPLEVYIQGQVPSSSRSRRGKPVKLTLKNRISTFSVAWRDCSFQSTKTNQAIVVSFPHPDTYVATLRSPPHRVVWPRRSSLATQYSTNRAMPSSLSPTALLADVSRPPLGRHSPLSCTRSCLELWRPLQK